MLHKRCLALIPKHIKMKSHGGYGYPVRYISCIRPDDFKKPPALQLFRFPTHSRLRHSDQKLELNKDSDVVPELLKIIEKNLISASVDSVAITIHQMHKSLDDIALEKQHEEELLQSPSFMKLIKVVEKLIDEMEVNDTIQFLFLCKRLHLLHKISFVTTALKKVGDNLKSLTLANIIKFILLLIKPVMAIDKQLVLELRKYSKREAEVAIKDKSYKENPDDIIAALIILPLLKDLPVNNKIHVLYSVLDLENWNNNMIFKRFLDVNLPLGHPLTEDIRERFLKRIKKEISRNNKYLSDFLVGFSKNMNTSCIAYDKDLIDAVIHKILKNDLSTQQIRMICESLLKMDHCNYEFAKYLVDYLRKNPNIYSSHPAISARIIETIANSNCNYKERNRWASLLPVINNNSNLSHVLESCRKDSVSTYLYFLTKLASLGIFLDEELNFFISDLNRKKEYFTSLRTRNHVINLHRAVKVLHPNFSKPILNDSKLSFIMEKISTLHKESRGSLDRLDVMTEIGKSLESSSGIPNCLLLNCTNKYGFPFDGLIGINREGKLLDFKSTTKKKEIVFIEDITLPKGYDLVALLLVMEGEHSKNTWDLKATSALRLKIMEGHGYRTVIFYENLW